MLESLHNEFAPLHTSLSFISTNSSTYDAYQSYTSNMVLTCISALPGYTLGVLLLYCIDRKTAQAWGFVLLFLAFLSSASLSYWQGWVYEEANFKCTKFNTTPPASFPDLNLTTDACECCYGQFYDIYEKEGVGKVGNG